MFQLLHLFFTFSNLLLQIFILMFKILNGLNHLIYTRFKPIVFCNNTV